MSGRRTGFLVGFFGALVLVATPAAGSGPAGAASLDLVTLNLWPSGQGKIEATPAGGSTTTCDYTEILTNEIPCPVTLERGASVTVTATAEPGLLPPSSFVHWSRPACEGTGPCTFVVDDDGEWITAVFTPLRLEVGIAGDGTVGVESPPGGTLACAITPARGRSQRSNRSCWWPSRRHPAIKFVGSQGRAASPREASTRAPSAPSR